MAKRKWTKDAVVHVRLRDEEHRALKRAADTARVSMSELTRKVLVDVLGFGVGSPARKGR